MAIHPLARGGSLVSAKLDRSGLFVWSALTAASLITAQFGLLAILLLLRAAHRYSIDLARYHAMT